VIVVGGSVLVVRKVRLSTKTVDVSDAGDHETEVLLAVTLVLLGIFFPLRAARAVRVGIIVIVIVIVIVIIIIIIIIY
jgi:hypothetical protein